MTVRLGLDILLKIGVFTSEQRQSCLKPNALITAMQPQSEWKRLASNSFDAERWKLQLQARVQKQVTYIDTDKETCKFENHTSFLCTYTE